VWPAGDAFGAGGALETVDASVDGTRRCAMIGFGSSILRTHALQLAKPSFIAALKRYVAEERARALR
jgi:hypothetical protein